MRGRLVLTLVGKGQAKVGGSFRLVSIPSDCRECRLYDICVAKLRPGLAYKIIEVRRIGFPQPSKCLLTGEEMVPVIAEEEPIKLLIDSKAAVEGLVLRYSKPTIKCMGVNVDHVELPEGIRVRVLRVLGTVKCNQGSLAEVEVAIVD